MTKLLTTAANCAVRDESFGRVHEALARRYKNANMSVGKAASYARLYALQVTDKGEREGRGQEGERGVGGREEED